MHYNQFTIDYIEAVKRNLKIQINKRGDAIFIFEKITDNDIVNLAKDLAALWPSSSTSIEIVRNKKDSLIQSGLFGLVNELEMAVKIGFLISDRVVFIDYLYERLLLKKEPKNINRKHLGVIASSLVSTLQLAQLGRIVIIPNPFVWYANSKQIISEVSEKTTLTPDLMSLLNMLSITKELQLHPYTIAESDEMYSRIIRQQIDHVDSIGRDAGQYAYSGLLGALLSERMLSETELNVALTVPLSNYYEIISSQQEFHTEYLSAITSGGSLNAKNNIDRIRNEVVAAAQKNNNKITNTTAKILTAIGGIGGGSIALLAATTVISTPLLIAGAALSLSATLTGLINLPDEKIKPTINVFKKLTSGEGSVNFPSL